MRKKPIHEEETKNIFIFSTNIKIRVCRNPPHKQKITLATAEVHLKSLLSNS